MFENVKTKESIMIGGNLGQYVFKLPKQFLFIIDI